MTDVYRFLYLKTRYGRSAQSLNSHTFLNYKYKPLRTSIPGYLSQPFIYIPPRTWYDIRMGVLVSSAQAGLALFSTIPYFILTALLLVVAPAYLFRRRLVEICRRVFAPEGAAHTIPEKPKTRAVVNNDDPYAPVSVNYFPSRECNYACGFCFHTNTSGYILPLDEAKRGLRLLAGAGMRKLNIAGGEPFLHPAFLGEILRYCKEALGLESVSIITNGSKVREGFFRRYGRYLDILAVSCDSFVQETNRAIGRGENGQGDGAAHVAQV